jgi:DNA-binding NarL/FixJ family response regulator
LNVLIAARSEAVRRAIGDLLHGSLDIALLREVGNGVEALRQFSLYNWDIVFLGVHLPEQGGLHYLRLFKAAKPDIAVVMVGNYIHPSAVRLCLQAGASGYLVTDTLAEDLLPSVQAVQSGKIYLSSSVTEAIKAHDVSGAANKPATD